MFPIIPSNTVYPRKLEIPRLLEASISSAFPWGWGTKKHRGTIFSVFCPYEKWGESHKKKDGVEEGKAFSSPHFSRRQTTENPFPWPFLVSQPHGKACYGGYIIWNLPGYTRVKFEELVANQTTKSSTSTEMPKLTLQERLNFKRSVCVETQPELKYGVNK